MARITIEESKLSFGINIPVWADVELEEETFESKEDFISYLKSYMMEELEESISRIFREDVNGDFDKVLPYWELNGFEIEDHETCENIDLVDQYKKDNKDFFENIVLKKLTKTENN